MSGHQAENNWLDELFRDGGAGLLSLVPAVEKTSGTQDAAAPAKYALPLLPAEEPAPEAQRKAYWRTLRTFFRTGKGGGLPQKNGSLSCYPALIAPFLHARDTGMYPCWISDVPEGDTATLLPLNSLLDMSLASIADEPGGKTWLDNRSRLARLVRKSMAPGREPVAARPVLEKAVEELVRKLSLKGKEGEAFSAAANALKNALPSGGQLIPFSPDTPLVLLAHLIQLHHRQQRARIRKLIAPLVVRIRQLLDVEQAKDPSSKSAASLESTMDFAGAFLNFDELAAVLPSGSGSATMPAERLHRLEQLLRTLEDAENTLFQPSAFLVIGEKLVETTGFDFREHFSGAAIEIAPDIEVFRQIVKRFEQKVSAFAAVFAAMRIAGLELDNRYHHDVHGDFFAHFSWSSFSEEELAACPPFMVLLRENELVQINLNDFSELLASNRPVKCLALKFDALGHLAQSGKPEISDVVFRQEPAAMAVAHRDAFVLQTTVADSTGLLTGLMAGMESPAPALFHVLSPDQRRKLPADGLLWASGALGGREFPSFVYDNRKGPKWGSRFDVTGNPETGQDWSEETLLYATETQEEVRLTTPFTFADFAAQDPDFERFFHLVPPGYWTDDLLPVHTFLTLPEAETYTRVPYIWMVDEQNRLHRAAVALPLIQICKERLDFWHFLQENAGVHSYHVEQATDLLRKELEAEFTKQLAELEAKHTQALETAREESSRTALTQLADFLLDLNVEGLAPANPAPVAKPEQANAPVKAPQPDAPPAAVAPPAAKPAEPETALTSEAWVETPLCTSCNECINTNDRIFKYNADKQAYVADPAAGPFADIVKAAESCPVAIIHPGSPLNPNEPGLDALVKRAAKFN